MEKCKDLKNPIRFIALLFPTRILSGLLTAEHTNKARRSAGKEGKN